MTPAKEVAGYPARVLEHFRSPRNAGRFPAGAEAVREGQAGSQRLGREVHFQLRLGADGRVAEARYRVYGCPATVALCSLASERLAGLDPAEAARLSILALAEAAGLPADKRGAALVVEDAIRQAAAGYNKERSTVAG